METGDEGTDCENRGDLHFRHDVAHCAIPRARETIAVPNGKHAPDTKFHIGNPQTYMVIHVVRVP